MNTQSLIMTAVPDIASLCKPLAPLALACAEFIITMPPRVAKPSPPLWSALVSVIFTAVLVRAKPCRTFPEALLVRPKDLQAKQKSAQALRQSILRHAFSGQLVPQDPNDEPASELLKRIADEREERSRLAKAAKNNAPASRTRRKQS